MLHLHNINANPSPDDEKRTQSEQGADTPPEQEDGSEKPLTPEQQRSIDRLLEVLPKDPDELQEALAEIAEVERRLGII